MTAAVHQEASTVEDCIGQAQIRVASSVRWEEAAKAADT
jgi:hypothetical protein